MILRSPLSGLLAAALLPSVSLAQATLTRTGGEIPGSIDYALTGPAGELYYLLPSLNAGPTPLAIVDPLNPGVLEVGIDLLNLARIGFLDGSGNGSESYPVPANPAFQGLGFYAQFVTISLFPSVVINELSNPTSFALCAPDESALTIGDLGILVAGHSLIELDDGTAILTGGGANDPAGVDTPADKLRSYDPQTQKWTELAATLSHERGAGTATKLDDGRVLYLGGTDELGVVRNDGDLYDPQTGLVTPITSMSTPRVGHTATLLADGRVFVCGGITSLVDGDPIGTINSVTDSSQIYDPGTDSWSNTTSLPEPRAGHAASLLQDERVLITAGVEVPSLFGVPLPAFSNDCQLYDPSNGSMNGTGDFGTDRSLHSQITLSDGRVLVVGGANGNLLTQSFSPVGSAWTYSAGVGGWTPVGSLVSPRAYANLHELPSGEVVVIGGFTTVDVIEITGTPATTIESNTTAFSSPWSVAGSMLLNRGAAISIPIEAGERVLITGAPIDALGAFVLDDSTETYVP